ncbi:protein starmaker isoform X2 [Spodoptera frugiperda]|uniref:Protein starmaker isoform X2 n=1 Tax=Spodoptera frugiperda TaxID=7108 RepID=A0A9R0F523_SPOFR|nr:protein starmaker isoform X2 [Spodoptera frugiperda]
MLLPGENSPKTWLFVTILVSTIIALTESSGARTLDVKIGFDITQGSNGAPLIINVRKFQDSAEFNPRAADDDSSNESVSKKKTSPRGSSESEDRDHDRDRDHPKKDESSKEHAKPAKSSNDSDDDEDEKSVVSHEDKLRSTRGLRAADFEPEEGDHRRYRRHIDRLANSKG